MRISRLDLIAYGPFTDRSLDLSDGREGLHLIYGPNEAGKSSSLRAILHFLYGIPAQTADNFKHAYNDLRIGATLVGSAGRLTAIRRKGNVNTLRSSDDKTPVEDAALRRFLPVDTKERFEQLFGINHERLLEGGDELLKGQGEFGSLLFAASGGITNLHSVQQELADSLQELYAPRSRSSKISVELAELKKAQERLHEAQMTPAEYKRLRDEYEESEQQAATIAERLQHTSREQERLTRLRKAIPLLAQRRQLLRTFEALRDAVLLPEDFALQHQKALAELRRAESEAKDAAARLEELTREAERLPVDAAVLNQSQILEHLYQSLGAYQTSSVDRARQELKLATAEKDARDVLTELRAGVSLEECERLRPGTVQVRQIHELVAQKGSLDQAYREAWDRVQQDRRRIKEIERELAGLPPARNAQPLLRALRRTQQEGDLETRTAQLQLEIEREAERLEREARALPHWQGCAEELEAAVVPLQETVERFELQWQEAAQNEQKLRQRLEEAAGRATHLESELNSLMREQEVPTEDDLRVARQARDEQWRAIRGGEQTLEQAASPYEYSVATSDQVADRLRREAARVTKKAQLLAEQEQTAALREQLQNDLTEWRTRKEAEEREWLALWPANVTAKPPREMGAWLRRRSELCTRLSALREKRTQLDELIRRTQASREDIGHELQQLREEAPADGETLTALQQRAAALAEQLQQQAETRGELQRQLAWFHQELPSFEDRMRQAKTDRERWRDEWAVAVQPLGLSADAAPADAHAVLEQLNRLFAKVKEIDDLRRRINGILDREEEYRKKVTALTATIAPDLAASPAEQAVAALYGRLTQAQQNQALLQRNQKDQMQRREVLEKARKAIRQQQTQIEVLCMQAQCSDPDDLTKCGERSTERRRIEQELRTVEERLADFSMGDLAALEREAEGVNGDELPGELDRLHREADELRRRQDEITQTLAERRHRLSVLQQDERAIQAAEEIEAHQASLGHYVEEYVRLRLASSVLQEAIRRYREKNQSALLLRAGELFRMLTNGSFGDLQLSWNERGEATLVGIRALTGANVEVAGMSEGTRDQLYLALRLASLESYCEAHEPAPFIVDDILINFDDQRSIATLRALAELSRKTQVLLFTHHEHLVDIAVRTLPGDMLFTHQLSESAPLRAYL